MIRLALFVALLLTGGVASVKYQDCGSTAGRVDDVQVANCDASAAVCVLNKGTDASLELSFTPNKPVDGMIATLSGIMEDFEMPFPLSNAVVCMDENSGVKCPLVADVQTTYRTSMPVLPVYPSISVTAKWELKDENDVTIVCVKIPVSIK